MRGNQRSLQFKAQQSIYLYLYVYTIKSGLLMSIINHVLFDIFQRIKEHSHFKVIVIQI